ncbi:MAG: HlyD family efflux transporter periplasmic adaptor subunit [Chiayiivirga sp.]|jgi:HlyD family secretion protein|uniref:HlyD family secretion protein n=1 Tax=Chiayiivirga sp. TaxID=2041042 RepID=UPI0025BBE0FA|nr:HlyD family efflux transporter periplasmic adaptor subunit [Chiayiivirga sp.]MCI1711214.1 HlyD family efflux transporter periplasmic adaptor subunit [Chiayiivirga sp.]MCI1727985.1 HlyD family efflux transporter periplasmic adaptor subunit [Chiayiivirga sp.]
MIRRIELGLAALLCALLPAARAAVLITGEVRAENAQGVYVPQSDSSPTVLRYYVPDGASVQAGEVVVRIDPGGSAAQIRTLELQIEQGQARAEKEIAELQVKAIDAERALVDADAALGKARVDAAIPRAHVSGLDYDRYQGELERATRERALKQTEFAAAEAAVQRRRDDGVLEVKKLEADRLYHQAQVANAEQRADQAGIVIHGFDNWRGGRYDEGSSAHAGTRIGEIVGAGGMRVRAYALEPDRAGLNEGQAVALSFDALPEASAQGRIERIAGAPEPKAEWGEGRWFSIDIDLPDDIDLPLKPGMSVRVMAAPAGEVASGASP